MICLKAEKIGLDLYQVESEKHPERTYVVDLKEKTCTCPHFRFRGVQCKHIHAVMDCLLVEKHIVTEQGNNFWMDDGAEPGREPICRCPPKRKVLEVMKQ